MGGDLPVSFVRRCIGRPHDLAGFLYLCPSCEGAEKPPREPELDGVVGHRGPA